MCSFSEVHDPELMWAHYAISSEEICIAYSFLKLRDGLADNVSFVRMFYNETVPTIRLSEQAPDELRENGPVLQELQMALRNANGGCLLRSANHPIDLPTASPACIWVSNRGRRPNSDPGIG